MNWRFNMFFTIAFRDYDGVDRFFFEPIHGFSRLKFLKANKGRNILKVIPSLLGTNVLRGIYYSLLLGVIDNGRFFKLEF